MKRLILAGLLVGMITGLCLAGVWSGQANPSTDGEGLAPAMFPGTVWLTEDPNDPNDLEDPNEPSDPNEPTEPVGGIE